MRIREARAFLACFLRGEVGVLWSFSAPQKAQKRRSEWIVLRQAPLFQDLLPLAVAAEQVMAEVAAAV
jgi:hypothetical protein